jgi:Cu2+-containing amine oxidase
MARIRKEMSAGTKALLNVVKPLTAKEERNATIAAVKYLGADLSQRYRVFPVELRIEKPAKPSAAPQRMVAVLVVDYENRRTIEVLVDAQAKAVGKTDLSGYQPAFLAEEIQQAREIAEQDERVAKAIRVRGVFASAFGPHRDGDPGARLVGLRFAAEDRKRGARLLGEAVVDLSAQKLMNFADIRGEEGN